MSDALTELETLREITRPRLNKTTVQLLRGVAEAYQACGDRNDRMTASGLSLLLDMHDRLEALRHGQA
jgi:hypothetical protein